MFKITLRNIFVLVALSALIVAVAVQLIKRKSEVVDGGGAVFPDKGIVCQGPFIVRKAGMPTIIFSSVKADFIGLERKIPFVIAVKHAEDAEFLPDISSSPDLRGVYTGGYLEIGELSVGVSHLFNGRYFDGRRDDYSEDVIEFDGVWSDSIISFELKNGRIFVVHTETVEDSIKVTQHDFDFLSPDVCDNGHSSILTQVSKWWLRYRNKIREEYDDDSSQFIQRFDANNPKGFGR